MQKFIVLTRIDFENPIAKDEQTVEPSALGGIRGTRRWGLEAGIPTRPRRSQIDFITEILLSKHFR